MSSRLAQAPLRIDQPGRTHLLVCDHLPAPVPEDADRVALETWGVSADADEATAYPSAPLLLAALGQRLARERIGLRLYAAGGEGFLSDVALLADSAGLGPGELFLQRVGPWLRRVQCVHCRAVTEDVATTLVRCSGCGAMLLVRDHFSRRLGAFMGVQIDAETRGEHPDPEALAS